MPKAGVPIQCQMFKPWLLHRSRVKGPYSAIPFKSRLITYDATQCKTMHRPTAMNVWQGAGAPPQNTKQSPCMLLVRMGWLSLAQHNFEPSLVQANQSFADLSHVWSILCGPQSTTFSSQVPRASELGAGTPCPTPTVVTSHGVP